MTTTPLPAIAIAPHCTITSCWAEDVHELHDAHGRVIAHYCPDHRVHVILARVLCGISEEYRVGYVDRFYVFKNHIAVTECDTIEEVVTFFRLMRQI